MICKKKTIVTVFDSFAIQNIFVDSPNTILKGITIINIYAIKKIAIFDKIATLMLEEKFMFLLSLSLKEGIC